MTRMRATLTLAAAVAVVVCLWGVNGSSTTARAQEDPQGIERTPAQVMSYRGAAWLERSTRDAEENPDLLLELIGFEKGDVVADIGCGTGFHARRISSLVGSKGRVLGVDIQPEMLEMMERFLEIEDIENVEAVLSTEESLNLEPGSLDWILLVDVYHEMQKPERMLAEMRRALKPTGRVALVEFRLEGETARHIKLDHRMSVAQARSEWEANGFVLERLVEELPTQHLFIFRPSS